MATEQAKKAPRQVAAFQSLRPVTVDASATWGAQIGVNLLLPDGTLGTLASLKALFGGGTVSDDGGTITTTDDIEEGAFHYWFTDQRAQDAVGAILVDSTTIDFSYATGSLTAVLKDLADSGTGAALVKITRDSKGRISGSSAATTDDLTEGGRLYYTNARADARITAQKGLANGLAPLESDGKISVSYLPAAVLGQVSYQGTWDASAGTPPTSTPEKGWYYIVTVAGTTDLDGITAWDVGDWAIYNGASWDKIDNTDAVVTVNGYTGAVTLTAADVGAATAAQGAKADSAVQSVTGTAVDNTDPLNPVVNSTGGGVDTSFKNRIINGDMAINQRAFAGGSLSAGVYGYDRWKAGTGGCSVSVSSGVITHTSGPLVQVLEAPNLASKTVTVSVEDPSGSVSVDVDGVTGTITSGAGRRGVVIAVPSGSTGNVTLKLTATGVTYSRVQLEVGGVATDWDQRHISTELAWCMRYFQRVTTTTGSAFILCAAYTTANAIGFLYLPVRMRANPSGTPTGLLRMTPISSASGTATLTAVSDQIIAVIVPQTGVSVSGAGYFAASGGNQSISLDAEL